MAKVKKSIPDMMGDNPMDDYSLDTFISLIRSALNGDKVAKKFVLNYVDFYEKNRFGDGFAGMYRDEVGLDDEEIVDNEKRFVSDGLESPILLPRPNVKEYHVRIKLNNTELKIWREVKVPSNITLKALAELLVEVMGWMMEHLYQFRFRNQFYCSKEQIEDSMFPSDDKDFSKVALSDVLNEKGVRMKLEYDYGDSWEHDVWVKGIREYNKGEKPSITFVTGHGECPPEDCGGVWGYADLLKLTQKKKLTAEERERLEWYQMDKESEFDPDYCDIDYFKEIAEDYNDAL